MSLNCFESSLRNASRRLSVVRSCRYQCNHGHQQFGLQQRISLSACFGRRNSRSGDRVQISVCVFQVLFSFSSESALPQQSSGCAVTARSTSGRRSKEPVLLSCLCRTEPLIFSVRRWQCLSVLVSDRATIADLRGNTGLQDDKCRQTCQIAPGQVNV
jgi:hypothetical protein